MYPAWQKLIQNFSQKS